MSTEKKFDVSILIPTVGRETLQKVLGQIEADSENLAIEIIIIGDGDDAMLAICELGISGPSVKIIQNSNKKGVSGALNTGLQFISGEFLMVFSDDDFWPRGKFARSLAAVQGSEKACFCFQVETVNKAGKRRIRPSLLPQDPIDPLSYCYSTNPLLENPSYLSLTSFIAPKGVSRIRFPENLNSREDIAWLYLLHKNEFKIFLKEGVNARVDIGYKRTTLRDTSVELISWLNWLNSNGSNVQSNFLYAHFLRPFAQSGKILNGIYVLLQIRAWKYRPNCANIKSISFLIIAGLTNLFLTRVIQENIFKFVGSLVTFIKLQIKPHRKRE